MWSRIRKAEFRRKATQEEVSEGIDFSRGTTRALVLPRTYHIMLLHSRQVGYGFGILTYFLF